MSELLAVILVLLFLPVVALVLITGLDVIRQAVCGVLKLITMALMAITRIGR